MRIALLALLVPFGSALAADGPRPAVRCAAATKGAYATFEVTTKGAAQLTVALQGGVATCPLRVRGVHTKPTAHLVAVQLAFDKAACKPDLPNADDLLEKLSLSFDVKGEKWPRGKAHWLKAGDSTACAVAAWDRGALELLAGKKK
jgi:hypothetical protein